MKYFLKKNGMYYRPNACGYTNLMCCAGVYTELYALSEEAHGDVQAVPFSTVEASQIDDLKRTRDNLNEMISFLDVGGL